jgi:hypothetical protein
VVGLVPWPADLHASRMATAVLRLRPRLLAAGFSDDEIRGLVRSGELSAVRRGAYIAGPLPRGPSDRHLLELRAAVVHLAADVVVSHVSAALLHGLPVWAVPLDRVHVTRNRASGGRRGRVVHVHVAPLHAPDVVVVDGVSVTSVARTIVDIARSVPFERAVVIADAALAMKLVTAVDLAVALLATTGWPGIRNARRVLAFSDGLSESVGESRSRVAIWRAGLPTPVLQWEVRGRQGRWIARTDYGWPELLTVGEFDGRVKYGRLVPDGEVPADVLFAEKLREDALRDEDLGVTRWVWDELDDFAPVAARIRRRFRKS